MSIRALERTLSHMNATTAQRYLVLNHVSTAWIKRGYQYDRQRAEMLLDMPVISFIQEEEHVVKGIKNGRAAIESDGRIAAFFSPDLHSCDYADNQLRLTIVHPTLYADHLPFAQKYDDGWMDFGVNHRSFWIAEYNKVPLSSLAKYSQARLNNGEIREITVHAAGVPLDKYEFLQMDLPNDQLIVQEFRRNENGEIEITLQNMGENITVELPEFGKAELPAYALRTFRWK
jgi:hypothetical protein